VCLLRGTDWSLNVDQVTISLCVNLADEFHSSLITVAKEVLQVQHNPEFNNDKKNDRKKGNVRERRPEDTVSLLIGRIRAMFCHQRSFQENEGRGKIRIL